MSSKNEPPKKNLFSGFGFTKTEIDLAEDLLVTQVEIPRPLDRTSLESSETPSTIIDQPIQFENTDEGLENARIFINEGMLEEAKRTLHRIILLEPRNLHAKRLLQDVHDRELKEIFLDAPKRRGVYRNSLLRAEALVTQVDASAIIKKLDDDLGLNFLEEVKKNPIHVIDKDLSPDDHVDIGIGFFEIGLLDSAVFHFKMALSDSQDVYVPTCLLAQAYIQQGNGFDASQILEPLVSSNEFTIEDKIEIYYLLGRAYALMNDRVRASQWFGEVIRIDSDYRDCAERLLELQK